MWEMRDLCVDNVIVRPDLYLFFFFLLFFLLLKKRNCHPRKRDCDRYRAIFIAWDNLIGTRSHICRALVIDCCARNVERCVWWFSWCYCARGTGTESENREPRIRYVLIGARISMLNAYFFFFWMILNNALQVHNLIHSIETSKVKLLFCLFLYFLMFFHFPSGRFLFVLYRIIHECNTI